VIKKALGNAYKWGNKRDQEKLLIVTTLTTGIGAVIKISDQGNGFDVSRVVRDRLFTRKGSGLTRFRKTSSIISYADGGRTLLIRFLCDAEADRSGTGTRMTATGAAPSNSCRIDLRDRSGSASRNPDPSAREWRPPAVHVLHDFRPEDDAESTTSAGR
jgi:hypothetical protein